MIGVNTPKHSQIVSQDKDSVKNCITQYNRLKIDVNAPLSLPEIAWGIENEFGSLEILGTLGNFSVLIGKAKAKKSFAINLILASLLGKQSKIKTQMHDCQSNILYFDTEQSEYHVQAAVKRIEAQGGDLSKLETYHLRSLCSQDRVKAIEEIIYNSPNVGFVVIDGLRDLICSINSEEEASNIISKLMKWTEERNIHILTVLHQNKGDNNARGHLGTEAVNKAETVLRVEAIDETTSRIIPETCRNKAPKDFSFSIDEDGIPEFTENIIKIKRNSSDILDQVFENQDSFTFNNLLKEIMACAKVGRNQAVELKKQWEADGLITQKGDRAPWTLTIKN
jgi:hypothetical protein